MSNALQIIQTMCVGHIVDAVIESTTKDEFGHTVHVCKFVCHHESKAKRLCLDLGQGWFICSGETFKCGDAQIERAAYWLKQNAGITSDNMLNGIKA
jgi:hypothetical protein